MKNENYTISKVSQTCNLFPRHFFYAYCL